ncbi:MAG: hypothetical protein RL021_267 [Bacteroidota bacterium]
MGGAFGAVGGDLSVLSYNPAGLGIYRSSEFSFSPSIFTGNTDADYLDGNTIDGRTVFNFGNIGIVLTSKPRNSGKEEWVSWNMGVTYNRIADFNNVHSLEGYNRDNSIADYFAEQAQGTNFNNLDEFKLYPAYDTYIIDTVGATNVYESMVPNGNVLQSRSAESRGSIGETNIAFSGNYANKLYLGASIGITTLRYTEDMTYEEIDTENLTDSIDRFRYSTFQHTEGSGVNFKFGFIYRPVDFFRFGAAIHTPTLYSLSDDYSSSMVARFDRGARINSESPAGFYEYEFTAPFRVNAGVAFIFGKSGLFSIDYDYTDISDARFRAPEYSFSAVNQDIRKKYTTTNNFRAGTEWRIDKFSLRGGFGLTTSPINEKFSVNGWDFSSRNISGGIGFREKNFYLDLAYLYSVSKQYLQPYSLENETVEGAYERVTGYNFTATFGVKF